jgi:hypothetical protein
MGGRPNCIGRSVIDDTMFDSGLYNNIGSIRFFKRKFDFENQFVGTLKTGYPHMQALSQYKEQDAHPHATM